MKKKALHLAILVLITVWSIQAQTLTTVPENPIRGESVTIQYDPSMGELADKKINCLIYVFDKENKPKVHEKEMKMDGGQWVTDLELAPDANLMSCVLVDRNDDEIVENNKKAGYSIGIYSSNGDKSADTYISYANLYSRFSYSIGIDTENEKALKKYKKAFELDTKVKNEHLKSYASLLARVKKDEAREELMVEVSHLQSIKRPTEKDLSTIHTILTSLKEKDEAELIAKKIKKKFKKGDFAINQDFMSVYREKDPEAKKEAYEDFLKKYDKEGPNPNYYLHGQMATLASKDSDWETFEKYVSLIDSRSYKANMLNTAASKLAGKIGEEVEDIEKAEKYSKKAMKLNADYAQNPGDDKPAYYTNQKWDKMMSSYASRYQSTYALVNFKSGNMEKAVAFQKKACKASEFKNPEQNETLAIYLEKGSSPQKAEYFLEKQIRKGVATSAMNDQYKRLFIENNSKEQIFEKYYAVLKKEAREAKQKEVLKKLMEEDAPNFELKNLEGETYSLADLKGKVVVVDFWATWCGPCIKSFPAMQKTVDKYKDNKNVEFLFIDTWQSEDNKIEVVQKWVDENPYTFNVLMDLKDEVVSKFKVSGIPTKFVIDKNGKIRFKSIGFSGSEESAVDELSMMIDIADEKSTTIPGIVMSGDE